MKTSLAGALFGKTKKAVIMKLFCHPEQSWHLRELARDAGVSASMMSKEIDLLTAAGIVLEQKDGNRRRLSANTACPIYEELRGIARKTDGIAETIKDALSSINGIDFAFIFGSVARGEERSDSDVDVCVIGDAASIDVSVALEATEKTIGRPVNPIIYRVNELREKVQSENYFVSKMLGSKKIFLIGGEDDFGRATEKL